LKEKEKVTIKEIENLRQKNILDKQKYTEIKF